MCDQACDRIYRKLKVGKQHNELAVVVVPT